MRGRPGRVRDDTVSPPSGRRGILVAGIALLVAVLLFTTWQIAMAGRPGAAGPFLDFHVFYLVGRAGLEGEIARVYHAQTFLPIQQGQPGFTQYLPYSYPPHASLAMTPAAAVPAWLGYLVFTGGSVAALIVLMWRLAPAHAADALLLAMPAIFVGVRSGQNGCLSAALIALVCLWWARRGRAGLPLGLLSYKPHIALGLGLAAVLKLRMRVLALAVAICLAAFGGATLVFGPSVWSDFMNAAGESTAILDEGLFPFHRMASVYAVMRSAGLSAGAALVVHAIPAILAVLALSWACLSGWTARRMLSLSVLSGLMISPYLYDYDVAAASVALALAGPDMARTRGVLRWMAGVGVVVASGWGLVHTSLFVQGMPALGGVGLAAAFFALFTILLLAHKAKMQP